MAGFSQDQLNSPYNIQILDDPLTFENVQDFSGGEDSFRKSTLLASNQCQHLLNVMVRDNYEARTRPGADAIPAIATPPIVGITAVYALRFFSSNTNGTVYEQVLATGAAGSTPKMLMYTAGVWTDLSSDWAPSAADDRVAMCMGVNTMLISDGSGKCQIYDPTQGSVFTQCGNTNTDAPVGCTILCWAGSRMFAAGVSTANDTVFVSDFLDFSDGHWGSGGLGNFRVGAGDGDPIVSLAPMQGFTIAVLKRNSVWLLNTAPTSGTPANGYIDGFSAGVVPGNIGYGIGCVGRDAWCAYGNDVLFMAQDGVRSVQRMQAAAGQWQLTAPISQPIQPYIERINQAAWSGICAIKYQEFAFFFVPLDDSTTNNYVLVFNGKLTNPQGQLGVWMGAWTNWTAQCCEVSRFAGIVRLLFGDTAGLVNQWKDWQDNTTDTTYQDNNAGYATQIWTRSFQFQEPVNNKTAYNTIIRFSAGNAAVNIGLYNDLALAKSWGATTAPTGDILGQGTLPFLLASTAPSKFNKGVRGLPAFNEQYLALETTSGWFWLRNIIAGAFINPLKETS
ncbi:MAG TPA: hypothetical protein VK731_09500 [Candidatus Cybelea sp.]|jgi:hypothetical protein|nr:hypothetical protein [Candidatus Cybelea sp.]